MSEELADELRAAIRACGLSALQLSKAVGVPQPTITEFLRGRDIRLSRAQKLAKYLGLHWCDSPKRAGRKPKRPQP